MQKKTCFSMVTVLLVSAIILGPIPASADGKPVSNIPRGIKIRGEVEKCLPTLEEAFKELKKVYMNVWVKNIWGEWKTIKMSDDRYVDRYTSVIWCNAPDFELAYGYAYVNSWERKTIHLSYAVFTTGDRGQTPENFTKDTAAVLLHETRHEQQWVEGWDFSEPDRDLIEFNAMTVQGQALKAMGWTNGYDVQKSYEMFMLYKYLIDTYQKPMSADLEKQLGFQHIYSQGKQIKLQESWYLQADSSPTV